MLAVQKHFVFSLILFCAIKVKIKQSGFHPAYKFHDLKKKCFGLIILEVLYLLSVAKTIQNHVKYLIWKRSFIWDIFLDIDPVF